MQSFPQLHVLDRCLLFFFKFSAHRSRLSALIPKYRPNQFVSKLQGCARDLFLQDRDETETETFVHLSETRPISSSQHIAVTQSAHPHIDLINLCQSCTFWSSYEHRADLKLQNRLPCKITNDRGIYSQFPHNERPFYKWPFTFLVWPPIIENYINTTMVDCRSSMCPCEILTECVHWELLPNIYLARLIDLFG
jgi:hypothetical protein